MTLYPRDAEIKARLSPVEVVGMTIWAEARSEPIEGEIAVGCVIRNRVLHPLRFGSSWKDVCLARWQFSCWIPQGGEVNYRALMARCEAAQQGRALWPRQALWIAEGIVSGAIEEDRVGGATHYFGSYMAVPPHWSIGKTPVVVIGNHRFYAGID